MISYEDQYATALRKLLIQRITAGAVSVEGW